METPKDTAIQCAADYVTWQGADHHLRVEPWGPDAFRIRATPAPEFFDDAADTPRSALLPPFGADCRIERQADGVSLHNGETRIHLGEDGRLRIYRGVEPEPVLEEPPVRVLHPSGRDFDARGGGHWKLDARFEARAGERFYGLGQHRHGRFDQKGCVIELRQQNCEVSIPFLLSSRGYGLLWNNPAIGRVELGQTETRWVAEATHQLDYWITCAEAPPTIAARYADATGHAPEFPEWAEGFWQSKLRYKNRDELMAVVDEHERRGLPLSVIVIDFFHWTKMGDFAFDEAAWPDPAGMVAELRKRGIETLVSVWPSFNVNSRYYKEFARRGLILKTEAGTPAFLRFIDTYPEGHTDLNFYDATHPEGRALFWEKARENYYAQGFRTFWIDCCEPQMGRNQYERLRFHAGEGKAVACLYPLQQERAFYEGMQAEGQSPILNLCRSGWAGSQRYGAAIWSGDIESRFDVLEGQIRAGLNMAVSGIPWWTTDIGGFMFGRPETEEFRELIVRWFQFGVFCPLFRLHGVREPAPDHVTGGAPNEVWTFGEDAYRAIVPLMHLRERLRPIVRAGMREASASGMPLLRPLFYAFANDEHCWTIEDQFRFGPDILVAPVTRRGQTERTVYLPAGAEWRDAWTGEPLPGGREHMVAAPLDRIPVFLRTGGDADPQLFQDLPAAPTHR